MPYSLLAAAGITSQRAFLVNDDTTPGNGGAAYHRNPASHRMPYRVYNLRKGEATRAVPWYRVQSRARFLHYSSWLTKHSRVGFPASSKRAWFGFHGSASSRACAGNHGGDQRYGHVFWLPFYAPSLYSCTPFSFSRAASAHAPASFHL